MEGVKSPWIQQGSTNVGFWVFLPHVLDPPPPCRSPPLVVRRITCDRDGKTVLHDRASVRRLSLPRASSPPRVYGGGAVPQGGGGGPSLGDRPPGGGGGPSSLGWGTTRGGGGGNHLKGTHAVHYFELVSDFFCSNRGGRLFCHPNGLSEAARFAVCGCPCVFHCAIVSSGSSQSALLSAPWGIWVRRIMPVQRRAWGASHDLWPEKWPVVV